MIGRILGQIPALFFVSITGAALFIMLMLVNEGWQALASPGWPTTQATVVQAGNHVNRTRGGRSYIEFAYQYTVDGRSYTSRRIAFFELLGWYPGERLRALLDQYPTGSTLTIAYSKTFPSQAVVDREFGTRQWLAVIVSMLCIIIPGAGLVSLPGALIVKGAIGRWCQRLRQPEAAGGKSS